MVFEKDKFINAALYLAKHTDPKKFGITKLAKLLYYSDFNHYRTYGRSITGDMYKRYPKGPLPDTAYTLLTSTFNSKESVNPDNDLMKVFKTKSVKMRGKGMKPMIQYIPLKDPDLSNFSRSELEVLKTVAAQYDNISGTEMSRQSHLDKAWQDTEPFVRIDYKKIVSGKEQEYSDYWEKQNLALRAAINS